MTTHSYWVTEETETANLLNFLMLEFHKYVTSVPLSLRHNGPLKVPTILTKYEGKEKGTEYREILLNVRSRNRIDKGRYKDKTKSLSFLKT